MQKRLFLIVVVHLVIILSAFNFPERPAGNHLVMDFAKMLSHTDKLDLSAHLRNFKDTSGIELLIVTIPEIEKRNIAEYSSSLAKKWEESGEIKSETILLVLDKKNLRLGIGAGSAFPKQFPPTIAENLEKKYFVPGSERTLEESLMSASARVMEIATGTLEETALKDSISPFVFWSLLILFIFFFLVYPIILYKSVRRSSLGTKPVSLFTAIALKHTFGSSNISGFEEFSTGRDPFASSTGQQLMERVKHGGGADGKW